MINKTIYNILLFVKKTKHTHIHKNHIRNFQDEKSHLKYMRKETKITPVQRAIEINQTKTKFVIYTFLH